MTTKRNRELILSKFSISFNLRRDRIDGSGEAPIYLIVRWIGNKTTIPTNEKVSPKNWNDKRGTEGFQRPLNDPDLTINLDELKTRVNKIFRAYELDKRKLV